MTTSGGGSLNALGYLIAIVAVVQAMRGAGYDVGALLRRPPRTALVLWGLVAVPSAVQFACHPMLTELSRQPALIRDHGQVWRLVTSAFVQDGGVAGTLFNLAVLYLVAALAVAIWGSVRTFVLFGAGAVLFNVAAVYAFSFAGAGNSGATFILATSILGGLVVTHRTPRTGAAAIAATAVGIVLAVAGDAHGLAFLAGLVVGVLTALIAAPHRIGPRASEPDPSDPDSSGAAGRR